MSELAVIGVNRLFLGVRVTPSIGKADGASPSTALCAWLLL